MGWQPDIYATAFIVANTVALFLAWRSRDWRLQVVACSIAITQNIGWLIDPQSSIRIDTIAASICCLSALVAVKDRNNDEIWMKMHPPWWLVPVAVSLVVMLVAAFAQGFLSDRNAWRIMNAAYAVQVLTIIVTGIRRIVAPRDQFYGIPDIAELE